MKETESGLWRRLVCVWRSLTFAGRLMDDFYRFHLGHARTIGFEDGLPVHSLFFPAALSDAFRHATLHMMLGAMRKWNVPSLGNVAVTDRCDANCAHCYFHDLRETGLPVWTGAELVAAVRACMDLGCCTVALVGGEPLLREDLETVVRETAAGGSCLLLFTNGFALAGRAASLRAAGLRRVFLTLTYPDAARQDRLTGRPGGFDAAIRGIRRARQSGMLTGVSMIVQRDMIPADLDAMAGLCRDLRVNELFINETKGCGRPADRPPRWDEFAAKAMTLARDSGAPFGVFFYPFFAGPSALGCSAGTTRVYLSPYGDVMPCDVVRRVFGNVRSEPLTACWSRIMADPEFQRCSAAGCRSERIA